MQIMHHNNIISLTRYLLCHCLTLQSTHINKKSKPQPSVGRPLSVHNPRDLTTSHSRPSRIEYEPYKRRAQTTLPSPTAMSTSMYEVFNWGYANDDSGPANANAAAPWSSTPFRTGKRMQFSIAGPQINIDDPLPATEPNYRSDHCSSGGGHGMSSARKGRQHRETLLLGGGGFGGGGSFGSAAPASNGERTQREHLHISPAAFLVFCYF